MTGIYICLFMCMCNVMVSVYNSNNFITAYQNYLIIFFSRNFKVAGGFPRLLSKVVSTIMLQCGILRVSFELCCYWVVPVAVSCWPRHCGVVVAVIGITFFGASSNIKCHNCYCCFANIFSNGAIDYNKMRNHFPSQKFITVKQKVHWSLGLLTENVVSWICTYIGP